VPPVAESASSRWRAVCSHMYTGYRRHTREINTKMSPRPSARGRQGTRSSSSTRVRRRRSRGTEGLRKLRGWSTPPKLQCWVRSGSVAIGVAPLLCSFLCSSGWRRVGLPAAAKQSKAKQSKATPQPQAKAPSVPSCHSPFARTGIAVYKLSSPFVCCCVGAAGAWSVAVRPFDCLCGISASCG
jgi:hypothetical protein